MEAVLNLYKERGETPLERIERFRVTHPEYKGVPMSYAGRLDPLAEGVLIVVTGAENRNREAYLSLPKEYQVDVLFGFSTDSYDLLGVLTDAVSRVSWRKIRTPALMEYLRELPGVHQQKYPPFSSKPFEGKPLFVKAKLGEINDFNLPSHEVQIYESAFLGLRTITNEELLAQVTHDTSSVRGDFRQEHIRSVWEAHLRPLYGISFEIARISVSCSTGTFMRVIANELGAQFGLPSVAFGIERTKVGKYTIKKAQRE
jgi:tRNA pseudouridine55 synthase